MEKTKKDIVEILNRKPKDAYFEKEIEAFLEAKEAYLKTPEDKDCSIRMKMRFVDVHSDLKLFLSKRVITEEEFRAFTELLREGV